jgi:DNA topoisomerase-1
VAKKSIKGLVIVESPAKAKKIGGYLGKDYIVMASMGHVRDLPERAADIDPKEKKEKPWAKLGVDVDRDFEAYYVVPKEKKKLVKELRDALKNAQELIIATDEDREGESIGWHLVEELQPKVPIKRMFFSEITKDAIQQAIQNTRDIDQNLVQAQETRRVLDRLYGYRLSPLLWKKIRPKLSAGRVQSVAVRMLVERELERLAFRKGTYWDLKAALATERAANEESGPLTSHAALSFTAELQALNGKRVASGKDFDESTGRLKANADVVLMDEDQARQLVERLGPRSASPWSVAEIKERDEVRRPYAPFTTSTLQQEANRKFNLSARETMQVAQRLYEDGYITYMRTDSVNLSNEAVTAARKRVQDQFGPDYLHPEVRQYTTKAKNAQEAHEAIRPAGTEMKTAAEHGLAGREALLYDMIWKRTVATQMAEARLRFRTAIIKVDDAEFRATGRQVLFAGFFKAYVESIDDPDSASEDREDFLPELQVGENLNCRELEPIGHETKPPARFTEATLVRELEADGIGRPSTYASIIGTVQDRGYVRKVGNQLVPTFTAVAVTQLLTQHFGHLVDYDFTAKMEQMLDDISNGEADRVPYLRDFYSGEEGLDVLVRAREENIDPREACTLRLDGLKPKIRVGKFGPYFEAEQNGAPVTASIPDDVAPADLSEELAEKLIEQKQRGPQSLGTDPESGLPIYLLVGPFGPYLQLGEVKEGEPKPKRVGLPKNKDLSTIALDEALAYMSLPRTVGPHPQTGHVVKAGIGRFGPYVQHEKTYKSLGKEDDVLTIGMDRAVELLSQARAKTAAVPLRELGPHPKDKEPVQVFEGRYGPYVKHGKINATIPKDKDPLQVTLEEAVEWIAEREAKGGGKPRRGGGRKRK